MGFLKGGIVVVHDTKVDQREKAYQLLKSDAEKIINLIQVQMDNLTLPQCPVYEDVLDTQMYGLSRQINFAVRLNLIDEEEGKKLLNSVERKLADLHEAAMNR